MKPADTPLSEQVSVDVQQRNAATFQLTRSSLFDERSFPKDPLGVVDDDVHAHLRAGVCTTTQQPR
jgi:hypothetical protein